MKPITDEIVLSLIERAERRQGVLRPANKVDAVSAEQPSGRIISLDFVRRRLAARQTVSGVFCYAPRN